MSANSWSGRSEELWTYSDDSKRSEDGGEDLGVDGSVLGETDGDERSVGSEVLKGLVVGGSSRGDDDGSVSTSVSDTLDGLDDVLRGRRNKALVRTERRGTRKQSERTDPVLEINEDVRTEGLAELLLGLRRVDSCSRADDSESARVRERLKRETHR